MRKLFFILWAVFGGLWVISLIFMLTDVYVAFPAWVIFVPAVLFTKLAEYFVGPLDLTTRSFIFSIFAFALCPAYAGFICLIAQKIKAGKLFFTLWAAFIGIWVIYMICMGIALSRPAPLARAFASFLQLTIFAPVLLLSFLAESLFGPLHWGIHLYIIFFSSFILCALYAGLISFIVKKIKTHKAAK